LLGCCPGLAQTLPCFYFFLLLSIFQFLFCENFGVGRELWFDLDKFKIVNLLIICQCVWQLKCTVWWNLKTKDI
jgi:hypothetical protein